MSEDIIRKKVLVSVVGITNGEEIKTISHGYYSVDKGQIIIDYEEKNQDSKVSIACQIKVLDGGVFLSKKGPFEMEMLFDTKVDTSFIYKTPFGEMTLGIDTKTIEIQWEEFPKINIEYILKDGEDVISACKVCVKLRET